MPNEPQTYPRLAELVSYIHIKAHFPGEPVQVEVVGIIICRNINGLLQGSITMVDPNQSVSGRKGKLQLNDTRMIKHHKQK